MDNARSGNMLVVNMKKEINVCLYKIENGVLHKRAQRQLVDGMKFLEMIDQEPYKRCKKVSDLKERISEERENLKQRIKEIERLIPGYQLSFFEQVEDIPDSEQAMKVSEKARLENEIKWLHKCLGICANRDYFK